MSKKKGVAKGANRGGKELYDAPIGVHKWQAHVAPSNKGAETPARADQMGASANYGKGKFLGMGYIGKRAVMGYAVHTPGNMGADKNLLNKTSKEVQVGKVYNQGTKA